MEQVASCLCEAQACVVFVKPGDNGTYITTPWKGANNPRVPNLHAGQCVPYAFSEHLTGIQVFPDEFLPADAYFRVGSAVLAYVLCQGATN